MNKQTKDKKDCRDVAFEAKVEEFYHTLFGSFSNFPIPQADFKPYDTVATSEMANSGV